MMFDDAAFLAALADESDSGGSFDVGDVDAFEERLEQGKRGGDLSAAAKASKAEVAKKRKGVTDKNRRGLARKKCHDGILGRAPRPMSQLLAIDWKKEIVALESLRPGVSEEATTVPSRDDALVLMAEYSESRRTSARFRVSGGPHPRSGVTPKCNLFTLTGACSEPNCVFRFEFKALNSSVEEDDDDADEYEYSWQLKHFEGHSPLCGKAQQPKFDASLVKKHRQFGSAYTTKHLSRVVAASHTDAKLDITIRATKQVLDHILRSTPSRDFARQVRDGAVLLIRGTPAHNFTKLKSIKKELERAGYGFVIHEADADEMNAVVVKRAEAEHNLAMKGYPKSKRTDFDVTKLKKKLPQAAPGQCFFSGWTLSLRSTKFMLDNGLLQRVFAADFAAAKGTFCLLSNPSVPVP
jgi:hypothetical protein